MRYVRWAPILLSIALALVITRTAAEEHKNNLKKPSETPGELPRIPEPNPGACELPRAQAPERA